MTNEVHDDSPIFADLVGSVRKSLEQRDYSLLADLQSSHPCLRRFLVGMVDNGSVQPAGTIYLRRTLHEIHASIQIPALSTVANYQSDSWHGLWELIEQDLAEGGTQWELTYKEKLREQRELTARLEK